MDRGRIARGGERASNGDQGTGQISRIETPNSERRPGIKLMSRYLSAMRTHSGRKNRYRYLTCSFFSACPFFSTEAYCRGLAHAAKRGEKALKFPGVLIVRTDIYSDPSGTLVAARVLVRVQGIIHRSPVKCFPADGTTIDVCRSLSAEASGARWTCTRGRDGHGTGRSQFDKVTRREDPVGDGRVLHPVDAVRPMFA